MAIVATHARGGGPTAISHTQLLIEYSNRLAYYGRFWGNNLFRYLFYSLESVVRWLRRIFRELTSTHEQTRSIEIAIDQLGIARHKLTGDPASMGLVRAQLAQVARFVRREALLDNDFDGTLAVLFKGNGSKDQILEAIDQLKVSLQTELEFVKSGVSNVMNSSTDEDRKPGAAGRGKTSKTAKAASSAKVDQSPAPESAVLWAVTEKLYQSWQFRLLGLVMLCAVGLAVGGTFVLGGQTFRLHENIDKAESDLKESKKLVEDLTKQNIADLTSMRKDAESKIGDLKSEAKEVKEAAVKRVVEQVNAELAEKLNQLKSEDAKFITSQMELLVPAREKLAEDIDKIKKTLPLLGDAAKLDQTIKAINAAHDQANSSRELAAQSAKEAKEAAQNEVAKMRDISGPLNDRMAKLEKSIPDLTPLNDRVAKLEKSAPDLTPLNDRVAKLEKSVSDLARLKVPDLTLLNDRVAKLEKSVSEKPVPDLTPLNDRVAKLEKLVSEKPVSDLTPLNERVAKLEKLVSEKPVPDLTPLNDRVARLEKSASDPLIPFEPDLTVDQWQKIQIALAARGFSPGKADGNSGSNTKNAIKQFQLKSGAPATGHLTKPQIAELLDLQSPRDKPR